MRPVARLGSFAISCALAVPLFAGFASTETFLPAVGRDAGQGGAQFYTTVWATNLTSAAVNFTFDFLKQGQANTTPASFADTLVPGQTKVYENVIESKLGLASAIGAARITSSGEILLAERIYNQAPGSDVGNTEGLFFAGVPKTLSISTGQSASIQGINQGGSENFRYNFALVETGGGSPTVNVQVFDGNGTLLGQKAYQLQPYEQIQPGVADVVAGIATSNARITATVTGGTGSVLLAGAQVANESQDSSGFEMSFRDSLLGTTGGTAGVTSLNGLTGALTLTPGSGISITPSGSSIAIAYTGGGGSGLTIVTHDASLTGSGTGASPLAIAGGQVVRSLNGLHDSVTLTSGSPNVSITPSGSTLAISAAELTLPFAGSTSAGNVAFEVANSAGVGIIGISTVTNFAAAGVFARGVSFGVEGISTGANGTGVEGDGATGVSGQGVAFGVAGNSDSGVGVAGTSNTNFGVSGMSPNGGVSGTSTSSYGVYGFSTSGYGVFGASTSNYGVYGESHNSTGVFGESEGVGGAGVLGKSTQYDGVHGEVNNGSAGVAGLNTGSGYGLYGSSTSGDGVYGRSTSSYAGYFQGDVHLTGTLTGGTKNFVSPHPTDPSKQIVYTCLEGPESGTYFRGSARIVNGFALIDVPEDFRLVTGAKGLTVVATAVGSPALLTVMKKGLDQIVVQASSDVEFDYMVNGIRAGFEKHQTIQENKSYVPRSADDDLARHVPDGVIEMLKVNGTLNADGSINLETAHRLGWDQKESWKHTEAVKQ